MPLVFRLQSGLSRSLVQKIKFAAPMYCESHWVSGDVYDASRQLHIRVVRSRFYSHHIVGVSRGYTDHHQGRGQP